jgi:hypothetical protein
LSQLWGSPHAIANMQSTFAIKNHRISPRKVAKFLKAYLTNSDCGSVMSAILLISSML